MDTEQTEEENNLEQMKDRAEEMIERHNWVPLNIHTPEGGKDE